MTPGSEKETPTIVDAVTCEPCGKILLASEYAAHKAGHETEQKNDRDADELSRYVAAKADVLALLKDLCVNRCGSFSNGYYECPEMAEHSERVSSLLSRIKEGR